MVSIPDTMTLTREMEAQLEAEINLAIHTHAEKIGFDNSEAVFTYRQGKGATTWVLTCCAVCLKPNILH